MKKRFLAAFLLPTLLLFLSAHAAAAVRQLRSIGIVFSNGGDNSVYRSTQDGLATIRKKLGVRINTYFVGYDQESALPTIRQAAMDNQLIIAVGGVLADMSSDVIAAEAAERPDRHFVLLDAKSPSPLVTSAIFAQNEACYLAGALAALTVRNRVAARGPKTPRVCGLILGDSGAKNPIMNDFRLGFEQGVRDTDRGITVLRASVDSWNDPERACEIALQMIKQGAQIIFHAAGNSGTGVIAAGLDELTPVIGVDAAQERLAPGTVLTAVLKHFGRAIYEIVQRHYEGHLDKGELLVYKLSNRGVGLSWTTNTFIPDSIRSRLEGLAYRITDGEIKVETGYTANGEFRKDITPIASGGKITKAR